MLVGGRGAAEAGSLKLNRFCLHGLQALDNRLPLKGLLALDYHIHELKALDYHLHGLKALDYRLYFYEL